jgi:hypothetical protein
MVIRCKLRRLRMGLQAIKYVGDLLALIGSKSGYIDQRFHALRPYEGDDRAGISVSG